MLFWDKLERANYFLEAIIETADRHVDDRTVAHLLSRPDRRRRPVEHVRRAGPQARPRAEGGHAGDGELVGDRPDERHPAQAAAPGRARPARARRRRGASGAQQARDAGHDPPRPVHPPRHAAGEVRVAVDGQRQGVPPRRRDHPGGVRRRVHDAADRRLRLPRARPARDQPDRRDLHRRVPRQRRRRAAGGLPERRDAT